MKSRLVGLLNALGLVTVTSGSFAQNLDVKRYDFNRDGRIDPGIEATVFFKHRNNPTLRKYDKDLNGLLDAHELSEFNQDIEQNVQLDIEDFDNIRADRQGILLAEIENNFGPTESKPRPFLGSIFVRQALEDVNILEGPKEFKNASAALVSLNRDIHANNLVWAVRGALMWPFLKGSTTKNVGLTDYALTLGVGIDRVHNDKNPKKSVNSLSYRVGSEFEFVPQSPNSSVIEAHYFRANIGYGTDTSFKSDISQFELQWEPVQRNLAIGTSRQVIRVDSSEGGWLDFRWRPILHAEIGHAGQVLASSSLHPGSSYFRVGPILQADIWPGLKLIKAVDWIERWSLNHKWRWLGGLVGKPHAARLNETALKYQLDTVGHYTLETNYRRGDTPLTQEEVETFTIGLGIKF